MGSVTLPKSIDANTVLAVLGLLFVLLISWSVTFVMAATSTDATNRSPSDANAARVAKYNQISLCSALLAIPVALLATAIAD